MLCYVPSLTTGMALHTSWIEIWLNWRAWYVPVLVWKLLLHCGGALAAYSYTSSYLVVCLLVLSSTIIKWWIWNWKFTQVQLLYTLDSPKFILKTLSKPNISRGPLCTKGIPLTVIHPGVWCLWKCFSYSPCSAAPQAEIGRHVCLKLVEDYHPALTAAYHMLQ